MLLYLAVFFSLCASMFIEDLPRRHKHSDYDRKLWKGTLESYSSGSKERILEFIGTAQVSNWCLTRPLLQLILADYRSDNIFEIAERMIDAGANINAKFNSGWIIDPVSTEYTFKDRISKKDVPEGHLVIRESFLSKLVREHVYDGTFSATQHDVDDPAEPPKHILKLLVRRGAKRADPALILVAIRLNFEPLLIWVAEDPATFQLMTLPSDHGLHPIPTFLMKMACAHGNPIYFQYLKAIRKELDFKLPFGENLLMYAYHKEMMEYLLEQPEMQALVNAANASGTALHYIAKYGTPEALKLLISHGANPWIINEAGNTAAMEATFHKCDEHMKCNVDYLIKHCPIARNKEGKTLSGMFLDASKDQCNYGFLAMIRNWERNRAINTLRNCIPDLEQQFGLSAIDFLVELLREQISVFEDAPDAAGVNDGDDEGSLSGSEEEVMVEDDHEINHGPQLLGGPHMFHQPFGIPFQLFLQQMGMGPMPPAPVQDQNIVDQNLDEAAVDPAGNGDLDDIQGNMVGTAAVEKEPDPSNRKDDNLGAQV